MDDERCGTCMFRHTDGKCKESHGKVRGDYDCCNAWKWDKINRPPTVQEHEFIDAPIEKAETEKEIKPMLRETPELNLDYLKKSLPTPKEPEIKIESGPPTDGLFENAFSETSKYPLYKGRKPSYGPLSIVENNSVDGLIEILHVNGMTIKPDILEFAVAMQGAFNINKKFKGTSWQTFPLRYLNILFTKKVGRIDDAYLEDTIKKTKSQAEIFVALGNYCWMMWKRLTTKEGEE